MNDSTGKHPAPRALGALTDEVQSSWHRFLDVFEPVRPELYRYCRSLTHSPWDAEDLVAETLMRGFVTLGTLFVELPNPRAWLFRVASNAWIDRVRRGRFEVGFEAAPGTETATMDADGRETRDAAAQLVTRLSPNERVAVLLKDAFEFSLEEIAEVLSTTTGTVKSALSRGRGKLLAPAPSPPPVKAADPKVLDAFCAAFNARDVERLTALLLDSSTVEIVPLVTEYGKDAPKAPQTGSFAGMLAPITMDDRGGVAPEWLAGYRPAPPRCEARAYRGGFVLVFWYEHDDGPSVRAVANLATNAGSIVALRNYFFSPDVIEEVCSELELPFRLNGYRYWLEQAP